MHDALTKQAVCDAEVVASDGVHTAPLRDPLPDDEHCVYQTLALTAGEYNVLVRRAGYVSAEIHGVEVHPVQDIEGCPLETAWRDVELVPE